MKKKTFSFICMLLLLFSCNKGTEKYSEIDPNRKTNNIHDPNNYLFFNANYHKKYGILRRDIIEYDINPIVNLILDSEFKLVSGYNFEFFNYDEELQIQRKVLPNIFASDLYKKITLKVVSYEDVSNFKPYFSEEYGEWGKVTVLNHLSREFIHNIIATPLATKYLKKRSITDSSYLIFVRFEGNKDYKDYLFCGSQITSHIIEKNYNLILTEPNMHH